jgi:phosphate:Na+ symporter
LSLASALGVVFGANVGTTMTAWIISAVGLKVKMNTFALPIVGVGALARLFLRGRHAAIGSALAGFGLVFVGIDVLQGGMADLAQHIDLARYAGRGAGTLILLALIGVVMTVVMQSSSAAVATTLAAVHGGTIGIVQAAALVIGQNVGTTVTAGIGSIGGSAAVRRTALAHLVFNLVTGAVAFLLLPALWPIAGEEVAQRDPAIVVSAFHTAFNVLGVLLFVPFTGKLAAWLERRIPEHGAELTRRLATGRGASASAVLEACRMTAHAIAREALGAAIARLTPEDDERERERRAEAIRNALGATREKLKGVRATDEASSEHRRHLAALHAIDHLYRFEEALIESGRMDVCLRHSSTDALRAVLLEGFRGLAGAADGDEGVRTDANALSRSVAAARRDHRSIALARMAKGELDPEEGERLLEATRWLDRLGYHIARALHHLEHADRELPVSPPPAPESQGRRGDESFEARP